MLLFRFASSRPAILCLSLCLGAAAAVVCAPSASAQENLGYQMPPQVLADIIDAPPTPGVYLSPDKEWLLLLERPGYPSIEEVAQPELRLAGLRINPRNNGPSRARNMNGLLFQRLSDGKEVRVTGFPEGAYLTGPSWSPDGKSIAFVVNHDNRLSLWYAELKNGEARRVTPTSARMLRN